MTNRRTVGSRTGTLKTMSKMTGKSAFAKLFLFTALSLVAVSLMSFAQKDDTALNDKNIAATATVMSVEANECCDTYAVATTAHLSGTRIPKVVLSNDFINTLRNIKLEVIKADREIAKSLYLAEISKKEAVVFFRNSKSVMELADMEVAEQMKEEAIKYIFFSGNADVLNEATGEVDSQMKETAVKIAINTSIKVDMVTADEEVAAGLQKKSPDAAVTGFMKGNSKNIADADTEISSTIKAKTSLTTKKIIIQALSY